MLLKLTIQNFVLIKKLEIDFKNGFTAITGETGAGKSIFLDALSLLLGSRADSSIISDKNQKCIIEGEFNLEKIIDSDFFAKNEIDYCPLTIIRREINPQGKSRAFVNDTPVNLNLLKEIGDKLIDIHSQYTTLLLSQNSFHLNLLDTISDNIKNFKKYRKIWEEYKKSTHEINLLKEELNNKEREQDYLSFLLNEIQELNPQENEKENIEYQLNLFQNSEKIKSAFYNSANILSVNENNALAQLKQIKNNLNSIHKIFPDVEPLLNRIDSLIIEIDDIATEITNINEKIYFDQEQIVEIETRLNKINTLLFKHKVLSTFDLLQLKNDFTNKIEETEQIKENLRYKEQKSSELFDELKTLANNLSNSRKEIIPLVEKKIIELLVELGMPNAKFQVKHVINDNLTTNGIDDVSFYFSANKGEDVQELTKVASGGELSRLMLALKHLIASVSNLPTLIFDEIDTGVSGEISKKMSNIFVQMGKKIQLIVITHLPQIAAKATNHYSVTKIETEDKTYSEMTKLNFDQRLIEISKMLGGDNFTVASENAAKELLKL